MKKPIIQQFTLNKFVQFSVQIDYTVKIKTIKIEIKIGNVYPSKILQF